MKQRCPSSTYIGVGVLRGWTWIINSRGYANIVASSFSGSSASDGIIYGLVYELTPEDESLLDGYEGVPLAYTKEIHPIEVWEEMNGEKPEITIMAGTMMQALVYVDRMRVEKDQPKEEYIGRMKTGISEAAEKGIPMEWMETVMGEFLPLKT